jgi:hypothetical protein
VVHYDAPMVIEGSDWLDLGAEATVRVCPLRPELWVGVGPGHRMEMREGRRVVGVATVIERVAAPTVDEAP